MKTVEAILPRLLPGMTAEDIRHDIREYISANPQESNFNFLIFDQQFKLDTSYFLPTAKSAEQPSTADNNKKGIVSADLNSLEILLKAVDEAKVDYVTGDEFHQELVRLKRHEKIALLLLDVNKSLLQHALEEGVCDGNNNNGVLRGCFSEYLKHLGPYIFLDAKASTDQPDYLWAAYDKNNIEAFSMFLIHYAPQPLKWHVIREKFGYNTASSLAYNAKKLFNTSLCRVITDMHNNKMMLKGLPVWNHVKNHQVFIDTAFVTIQAYRSSLSTEKDILVVSTNNSINSSNPDKQFQKPSRSIAFQRGVILGLFMIVGMAVTEGLMWHTDFLNNLIETCAGLEDGESLSAKEKGGFLAFSSIAAGLVTGTAVWGATRCFGKPKLT